MLRVVSIRVDKIVWFGQTGKTVKPDALADP
jgi:hypothetical protein